MIRGTDSVSPRWKPRPINPSRKNSKKLHSPKLAGIHSQIMDSSLPRLRIFAAPISVFQPYGVQQQATTAAMPNSAH